MSTFSVDPQALTASQPQLAAAASKVGDAIAKLKQVVAAEGECWGGDEIGQNFAKNYTPGATEGMQGIDALSKAVDSLGDGVTSIAAALQNQDAANAAKLKAIT